MNIILGNTLKNTYLCLNELVNADAIDNYVRKTINSVSENAKSAINSTILKQVMSNIASYKSFVKKALKKSNEMAELVSDRNKAKVFLREKVKSLCNDIDNGCMEIETFAIKYDAQQMINKVLWESHEKTYKKLKKLESNKSKGLEQFCKNCHKWYRDTDNFNWSCKRHAGEWNNFGYWCCGDGKKDSPGCIISFHIPDESEGVKIADMNEFKCHLCNETGHPAIQCPKDPNCHNTFSNSRAEIERIIKVRKRGKEKSRRPVKQTKTRKS